jgi:hypothetical protein
MSDDDNEEEEAADTGDLMESKAAFKIYLLDVLIKNGLE